MDSLHDNGGSWFVIGGERVPMEPGYLLEHPSGEVWLPESSWSVKLTPDHVRATNNATEQRLEWDRWSILVTRVRQDGDAIVVEPVIM